MRNAFEIADRLLVSGPNGGGLAMVTRSATALLREASSTGIGVGPERLAWCLQSADSTRLREFADGVIRSTELSAQDMDLHDLLADGEGWLAVATMINSVVRVDGRGVSEYRRFAEQPDSWHLNSLARYRDLLVASAFGRFEEHRGYKGATRGSGEVFAVDDGQQLIGGLSQPHSLVADGANLWLCNSELGEVHCYRGGKRQSCWTLPGYTRGLAVTRKHVYVGISLSRNPGAKRDGQHFSSAVVAVLDRADGQVQGYIALPWREIYDIRILDQAELAEDLLLAQLVEAPGVVEPAAELLESAVAKQIQPISDRLALQHGEIIRVLSEDIHRMQDVASAAQAAVAARESQATLASELSPRLAQLEALLAPIVRQLPLEVHALAEGVEANRAALIDAVTIEIRRMQDVASKAEAGLAVREREASLVLELGPRLSQLEAALAPLSGQLTAQVGTLETGLEAGVAKAVEAIRADLSDLRRAFAQAQIDAGLASDERDAASSRDRTPRLERIEAAVSEGVLPRLEAVATLLAPLPERLHGEIRAVGEGVEASRVAVVEAISLELRRLHDIAAQAQVDVARQEAQSREAARMLDVVREQMDTKLHATQSELAGSLAKCEALLLAMEATERSRASTEASLHATQLGLAQALASSQTHQESVTALEVSGASMEAQHQEDLQRIADAQSRTQKLSTEIAILKYELERLRTVAQQFEQIRGSRSWRWTRPLRALARWMRGDFGPGDRARLRRALGRSPVDQARSGEFVDDAPVSGALVGIDLLPSAEEAAVIRLAPAQDGLEDVFVWAVIDWHFRFQRPQHLARALAQKGHRVFYISNNFNDSESPGFHIDPLGCDDRLFQVHLNLVGRPPIYFGMPAPEQVEAMRASLAVFLAWSCTRASVSVVQHPYWSPLVRAVPSARVVYDCMDHHGGFENNAQEVLEAEARLVEDADLVIVTSAWLEQEIAPRARATSMVRNAGEFDFFRDPPAQVFRDPKGRRVIGYYGAIAEWFDVELVRLVAGDHPDCLVLLVGNDTIGAGDALADLANVQFTGEVPYATLPYWLHGFDVCLLPFRVIPLTLATNPVKVYEYLSAGKPVVSVDLPEMAQFDGLVSVAGDAPEFSRQVGQALGEAAGAGRGARQAFAAQQTWVHRATSVDEALANLSDPKVSVIVLTYNNLAFTEACLFSLEAYSDYRNLEVIVVDNASSDGSREWLAEWVAQPSMAGHERRLILNDDNLGFSAGNNVGLRAATGEVLVLLNNDTYVTPGWVRGLCNHLRDEPRLGLLGPVTNNIGNEARIEIGYADMSEMIAASSRFTRAHPGARTPMRTAAFFCVAMRREVYEKIGDMDEDFGVGFFEDDDYSRRIEGEGLQIACADDVFVHHHLSASFDQLKAEKKQELFNRNKAIYEAKWGAWEPHKYRG